MKEMTEVIRVGLIDDDQVKTLLNQHVEDMYAKTPAESVHAFDLDRLKANDIAFYTLWIDEILAGCGAIKELSSAHGEIKSMRTSASFLRRGVAEKILTYMIEDAKMKGYSQLSLESGASHTFYPAHALYKKMGFELCDVFGDYKEDPNSLFMTLVLK